MENHERRIYVRNKAMFLSKCFLKNCQMGTTGWIENIIKAKIKYKSIKCVTVLSLII